MSHELRFCYHQTPDRTHSAAVSLAPGKARKAQIRTGSVIDEQRRQQPTDRNLWAKAFWLGAFSLAPRPTPKSLLQSVSYPTVW
jgi:hypothetical protein